ncbi:ABC transporter permease [Paenibacillus durus]|uniref:ABC transmembrane type-1 domain-containing protein n=1 Tax=Paenibacillus durus ATCC 35681 TaxID=1333534 RepID=A0A0F7FD59_PAEDU|nr:ABC transporter permease subunit [Paenibacillus durus]AKG36785.1 hypothetical protein VK70_21595 [Paenibacillus durus ATCC 35681]
MRNPSSGFLISISMQFKKDNLLTLLLLFPGLVFFIGLFIYPLCITFMNSLTISNHTGYSLQNYIDLLSSAKYWNVIGITFVLAISTTILSVLIALPLALILRKRVKGHTFIRLLILLPLTVLALISALGLLIVWDKNGWVNLFLMQVLPIIDEPLKINYTLYGLILFYAWLYSPHTILMTLSSIEGIDRNVEQAATITGAKPFEVFRYITLPLSMSGIRSGSVMTFLLAFGAFNVPLIAGGNYRPLTVAIYTEAGVFNNWPRASALAIIMGILEIIFILIYFRLTKKRSAA